MISRLKSDLIKGLDGLTYDQILKSIGYRKPNSKNHDRLKNVLNDDLLGLDGGGFDLKYGSVDFLLSLCELAELDMEATRSVINATKSHLSDESQAFKPYIWVNTQFKRTSQSLMSLAACESFRYIRFPEGFWRLPLKEKLEKAQSVVQHHMVETDGNVKMWGAVHDYWFFYEPNKAYVLSPSGEVKGEKS